MIDGKKQEAAIRYVKLEDNKNVEVEKPSLMNHVRELVSGWIIVFHYLLMVMIQCTVLFITTKNLTVSLVFSLIMAIPSLYFFTYLSAKTKKYHINIKQIGQYASIMTYSLANGSNVLNALHTAKDSVTGDMHHDIVKLIEKKQVDSYLDTDHFKKYNFPALNAFNDQLKVKDSEGGDAKEIFYKANKEIVSSITDYDWLMGSKKDVKTRVYLMFAIVASIPLILAFFAGEMYEIFITTTVGVASVVALYALLMIFIFALQKEHAKNNLNY